VDGSFYEWGEFPQNDGHNRNLTSMGELLEDVKNGLSTLEILDKSPQHALRTQKIDELRQNILFGHFAKLHRDVICTYIWGETATGKTRFVYDNYPEVCRITNYQSNALFDPYKGESAIFFDEFRSQIPISDMLVYLDRYPITSLPARYYSRTACYKDVFIASNIPLSSQYPQVQQYEPETWKSLIRRINKIIHFHEDGTMQEQKITF